MTTSKPQLLIYNDGAVRIDHRVWDGGPPHVIQEALYVPMMLALRNEQRTEYAPKHDIVERVFVRRVETRRYVVYEEQP